MQSTEIVHCDFGCQHVAKGAATEEGLPPCLRDVAASVSLQLGSVSPPAAVENCAFTLLDSADREM